jgi:hypothetical protein
LTDGGASKRKTMRSVPALTSAIAGGFPRTPAQCYRSRQFSRHMCNGLISCFFARTGVPVVINTSFNDSEPIVCTPADAIVTFRKTGIDALFIDDVYLTAQT